MLSLIIFFQISLKIMQRLQNRGRTFQRGRADDSRFLYRYLLAIGIRRLIYGNSKSILHTIFKTSVTNPESRFFNSLQHSRNMAISIAFSTNTHFPFSPIYRSISSLTPSLSVRFNATSDYNRGFPLIRPLDTKLAKTRAALSEISYHKQYPKVGAKSIGPIPPAQLIQVVENAAKAGAEVCDLMMILYPF